MHACTHTHAHTHQHQVVESVHLPLLSLLPLPYNPCFIHTISLPSCTVSLSLTSFLQLFLTLLTPSHHLTFFFHPQLITPSLPALAYFSLSSSPLPLSHLSSPCLKVMWHLSVHVVVLHWMALQYHTRVISDGIGTHDMLRTRQMLY